MVLTGIGGENGVFVFRAVCHVSVMHDATIIIWDTIVARSFHFIEIELPGVEKIVNLA